MAARQTTAHRGRVPRAYEAQLADGGRRRPAPGLHRPPPQSHRRLPAGRVAGGEHSRRLRAGSDGDARRLGSATLRGNQRGGRGAKHPHGGGAGGKKNDDAWRAAVRSDFALAIRTGAGLTLAELRALDVDEYAVLVEMMTDQETEP